MTGPLVSTAWLAEHLEDPSIRVADCRWYLAPFDLRDPDAEYARDHIGGAVHLRWDRDYRDPDHRLPGMLADPGRFAEAMGAAGIGDDTLVVAYDDNHVTVAARLWWALRTYGHDQVVVLDGGYGRWVDEGRAVTARAPTVVPAVFTPRFRPELHATRDDVLAVIGDPRVQLLDGRMEGAYLRDGGSIPDSVRHPGIEFVGADGGWPQPGEARARLAGVLDRSRLIAYCSGGVGACGTALACAIAGRDDVAVYDGSWTEWGADPDTPKVPIGEAPGGGVPIGEAPGGGVPIGEVPGGGVPIGEVPGGGVPIGEAPVDGVPIGEAPVDGVPIGEAPGGGVPIGEAPGGGVPIGEAPGGGVPIGEVPGGGVPIGEAPVDGVPIGEAP